MKKIKLLILLSLLTLVFVGCRKEENKETDMSKPTETVKEDIYSPIDGGKSTKDENKKAVIGIMIDNHPGARPQSGLEDAGIIYEFKVEGDFTRYLALFQNANTKQIGPVRSARPYFVEAISEYDGIYAHFGGSDEGIRTIGKLNVDNLDGMELEHKTFIRNKDVKKVAPHNAYTSMKLLNEAIKDKNYKEERDFTGFKFDLDGKNIEEQMSKGEDLKSITIPFNSEYTVGFDYNNDSSYTVSRNNQNFIDEATDNEVSAKNIIIQYADSKVVGAGGTLAIATIGEGKGKFITDGKIIDITWSKASSTDKTIFKTLNNEEILLNPGQTWIEVVDTTANIDFK